MAIDTTFNYNVTSAGTTKTGQIVTSTDNQNTFKWTVADSVTDQLATVSIDFSLLKFFSIESNFALTVETNSSSAPDDTIVLTAAVPLIWFVNGIHANPFSADVTKFYLTNASGSTAIINCTIAQDSTP